MLRNTMPKEMATNGLRPRKNDGAGGNDEAIINKCS